MSADSDFRPHRDRRPHAQASVCSGARHETVHGRGRPASPAQQHVGKLRPAVRHTTHDRTNTHARMPCTADTGTAQLLKYTRAGAPPLARSCGVLQVPRPSGSVLHYLPSLPSFTTFLHYLPSLPSFTTFLHYLISEWRDGRCPCVRASGYFLSCWRAGFYAASHIHAWRAGTCMPPHRVHHARARAHVLHAAPRQRLLVAQGVRVTKLPGHHCARVERSHTARTD